jgi:hypothetical protein
LYIAEEVITMPRRAANGLVAGPAINKERRATECAVIAKTELLEVMNGDNQPTGQKAAQAQSS